VSAAGKQGRLVFVDEAAEIALSNGESVLLNSAGGANLGTTEQDK
jgi:hypothetical protein